MAGDIVIADENPEAGGYIYRAHWNGTNFNFYPLTDSKNQWEQITFAPVGLPGIPQANNVQLQGVVIDDGELFSPTSNNWNVVSGPGPVTLGDPTQTNTTVEFSVPGDYILQLSAYDGQYTSSSNVTIHVLRNKAPWVSAGTNQIILTNTIMLSGSVTDDTLPFGVTNVLWSTVGVEPGTVTFSSTNQLRPSVSFGVPGTYVLQLTADDGQATNSAQVTISVKSPSLTLTPSYGSATRTSTNYSVTAQLVNTNGNTITNVTVNFTVNGANPTSAPIPITTDVNGNAVFSYWGVNNGRDSIQSYISWNSLLIYSPTVTKEWGRSISCGNILLNQTLVQGGRQSRGWPANGTHSADYYIFSGIAGESIQLTLGQKDKPVMFFLRDPFDQLVAVSPVSFTGNIYNTTGVGDAVSLNYTLLKDGDFVIEVAAIFGYGNYDLYLSCSDEQMGLK